MKKFLSGFLSCAIIMTLALSVMAITGKTTIDVYPIDIMVNGEVFQPTNAQGKPVDVFTYKGTTYAPLRALAVAYGLEVGYDAEKKLATVSEPANNTPTPDTTAKPDYSDWSAEEEAAYQEFKGLWTLDGTEPLKESIGTKYRLVTSKLDDGTFNELSYMYLDKTKKDFFERLAGEIALAEITAGTDAVVTFSNENLICLRRVINGVL